ncbi:MAG: alpha-hydroxy-acid oxidizing protein, partial [Gammaproteobacteria bacterium]
ALALGADACLIGRAWAFALAARGEAGVAHLLESMRQEMDVALALCGVNDARQLGPDALARAGMSP